MKFDMKFYTKFNKIIGSKKQNNRGFSLVELLIAMVILSIIMISIASFASTTSSTYVRSKSNAELQEDGSEVLDLLSDKIMQAKCIRVGTDVNEYCVIGDQGSVSADDSGQLLDEDGNALTGVNNRKLYSFHAMTEGTIGSGHENLKYIAVMYDGNIGSTYGTVVDVFYFYRNYLFLFREFGDERNSATEATGEGAPTDTSMSELQSSMTTVVDTIASKFEYVSGSVIGEIDLAASALTSIAQESLVCDTLDYVRAADGLSGDLNVSIYAIPDDSSLNMTIHFWKTRGKASNTSQGVIAIRNGYVLEPRGYKAPSSSEDTP